MYKSLMIATALTVSAATAQASLLDFETGFTAEQTTITGTEFESAFGVTFTSQVLKIARVGGTTNGFVPNDTPNPADALGGFFLTSDFGKITTLNIDFTTAVSEASFDVADIDGSGKNLEVFTFTALDGMGNTLQTKTVNGQDANAGDAIVTRIGFSGLSGLIKGINITGTTAGGNRNIGIAFDNFNTTMDTTTPIPLPAGAPLVLAGMGALAALRARRKA